MYEILLTIYSVIKVVATLVTMAAVSLFIYSFYRLSEFRAFEKKEIDKLFTWRKEKQDKNTRWEKLQDLLNSQHPSDWKIAILEADSMLDDIIKRMGIPGDTMGDRMKALESSSFPHLDDAWSAHKVRNAIAHQGQQYPITRTEADDTLDKYFRVFQSLGYL